MPIRAILEEEDGVTVSYEFPGAVVIQDDLYPNATLLTIPGFGHNSTLREPN